MKPSNRNRYFVSVDIEGITGVSSDSFASHGKKDYEHGRRYMAHDTNAVIEGILRADPEAEILVRDAHGSSLNLDLSTLHPKASLLQGWGTSLNMMEGLDSSFRAAFLVGYHAGGHNDRAVLSHTFMGSFAEVRVNDQVINETGIAALCAEPVGVPIVFLSGDDEACREAGLQIPGIQTVEVKKSIARDCTVSLPLEKAAELLKQGVVEALRKPVPRFKIQSPYRTDITLFGSAYSPSLFVHLNKVLAHDERFAFDPERNVVRFETKNASQLMERLFLLIHVIAGIRAFHKND